jgi:hypothetical protein
MIKRDSRQIHFKEWYINRCLLLVNSTHCTVFSTHSLERQPTGTPVNRQSFLCTLKVNPIFLQCGYWRNLYAIVEGNLILNDENVSNFRFDFSRLQMVVVCDIYVLCYLRRFLNISVGRRDGMVNDGTSYPPATPDRRVVFHYSVCVCNRRILTSTLRSKAYEMKRKTKAICAETGGH